MSTTTTNLGLTKPALGEPILISDINGNSDILDAAIAGKIPLGLGTAITDPDAANGVYADLFTLPVGVHWRQTNVTNTRNLPNGVTGAFFCYVVNTISASRKKIYLFPCSSTAVGEFYTCTQMSGGYGSWYKFSGTVVT